MVPQGIWLSVPFTKDLFDQPPGLRGNPYDSVTICRVAKRTDADRYFVGVPATSQSNHWHDRGLLLAWGRLMRIPDPQVQGRRAPGDPEE